MGPPEPSTHSSPDSEAAAAWPPGSYLGLLGPATRDALLELGTIRRFSPGQVFITEGDQASEVFIILEGVAKVTGTGGGGTEVLIDIQVRGNTVGEMAALDGRPRSATVTAAGDVTASMIRGDDLLAFFRARPDALVAMTRLLSFRARQKVAQQLDFSGHDVKTRLARTLAAMAERFGSPAGNAVNLDIALTQADLASLVGAAEPTLHKALRDLRTEGAIVTHYRRMQITDLRALRRIADLTDR